jgi:hypothetical protein
MTVRCVTLAVTCALAALLSGCGGGDDDGGQPVSAGTWGVLGAVVDLYPDTPERAVSRYTARLEAGASLFGVAQYAPEVRRALGLRRMVATLEQVGVVYARGRTRVVGVTHDGPLTEVKATVIPEVGERRTYRFELIRRDGRWLITFDGLTKAALEGSTRNRAVLTGQSDSADEEIRRVLGIYEEAGLQAQAKVDRP